MSHENLEQLTHTNTYVLRAGIAPARNEEC